MTNYNSQVGGGKYCIQYETDNKENYKEVQELIRKQIDCGADMRGEEE